MDRLGAGLQALAAIIVAALFVRSRPARRGPKVPIRSTLTQGIPMTDASSSTASSQQQRLPRFADSAPFGVRELAPAFDGDECGVKPPHALGAGLTTPTKCSTVRSPAFISALGLNQHPISKHAPKDGDLRAGTRAGSGDPRPARVRAPHALGAGLTTPSKSPTVRSPAVISGLGLNQHPISKHAPKDGDLRAGTRAGSGDPRPARSQLGVKNSATSKPTQ
jgi:hypothetical protein